MTTINPYWGTDLYILNGDLAVLPNGDLATITGSDNINQALQNRLATEVGFLDEDATYGNDISTYIGRTDLDEQVQLISISTSNALSADPRVASIDSIAVNNIGPGTYSVFAQVSIHGSPDPLNLNFTTPFNFNKPLPPAPNTIQYEAAVSSSRTEIDTMYSIYAVSSVYLQGDINGVNGDFFAGGNFADNAITLGTPLPKENQNVLVTYQTYDDVRPSDVYSIVRLESDLVLGRTLVQTNFNIKSVIGVFLTPDENSKNYFYTPTGFPGSYPTLPSYNTITLGTPLPVGATGVFISYVRLIQGT